MEELELRQYWAIIRKRWRIVIAIPVIAVIISALVSLFILQREYQANTTLLVNQKQSSAAAAGLQYQDILANQAMVSTYTAIIKSYSLEASVVNQLGLSYTPKQLDGMINVSSPTQSEVIQISVTSPNLTQSVDIANALAADFQGQAKQLTQVQNVQVVDYASAEQNPNPVKPNKKLNVAIALILGLMVSVGLAFLLEYLDNRIRTVEDVERYLQLPVLGTVVEYDSE